MTINQIREKYLKFFEKRGHTIIDPAALVLENDPTTLFTSSGMQPLVPYLLGESHPSGVRLVDSQPSIRVQDIEEVGDNRHTTFFEMLGNWSLGDYFKEEQLGWIWEFLTDKKEGLGLPSEKLFVSIFEGNGSVPRDEEAYSIWKKIGVPDNHIFEYGVKKNWWSRSGTPDQMPAGEIGGPDSEIFFDFGQELGLHEKSAWSSEDCHPNCDCGRFMEIGNSVFIQYKKMQDGTLEELPQKNVDFGGGLERLAAAVEGERDIFKTKLFLPVIERMESEIVGTSYSDTRFTADMRILADHIRASIFLIKAGVMPSNKMQGYVLRRLLRRSAIKLTKLGGGNGRHLAWINEIAWSIIEQYEGSGYFSENDRDIVATVIGAEMAKFGKSMEMGLREVEKIKEIDGKIAFDLYQTFGFPLESSIEIFQEKGQSINVDEFKKAFEEHQTKSRSQSAGVFKGGLADHSGETTALHTVTHLLHAALRQILGDHVQQKGSNITHERLRFDFIHSQKLTEEETKKIENLVNEQIDQNLTVGFEMMSLKEADSQGALHFFDKKYDDQVKVYTIGDPKGKFLSKEVCGGPHVEKLSEIGGHVTITREESVSSGVRRMYATITK